MICIAELHAIINNNEINSLSLCYLFPPSLDSAVCVSEVSQVSSSIATSSCTSLIKGTPTKHCDVHNKDNNQLQFLLENFCDVFLDDLPSRLPLERTTMHGIDLLPGIKLVSQS